MRQKHILPIIIGILLCAGSAAIFASGNVEIRNEQFRAIDLNTAEMDVIIDSYNELQGKISLELQKINEDLLSARRSGDLEGYRHAYGRLLTLSSYALSKDETDMLLARILAEEEPLKKDHATWLYETSTYYRPTLSMEYSENGDSWRYSYTQQIRSMPGSDIKLPDTSSVRIGPNRTGILAGWGLTPHTIDYGPGTTIKMPYTDQTLYAIWRNRVVFSDSVTGTEVMHEDVDNGVVVEVPLLTAPDDTYRFAHWYDPVNRISVAEESYAVQGNGALFEAKWKQLSVEKVNTLFYDADHLPVKTQISVGFSLHNGGNTDLIGLVATLSSDSPYVTVLDKTISIRSLPAGTYGTNNSSSPSKTETHIIGQANTFRFVIDADTPSKTVLPFSMTINDRDGETWTYEFSLLTK